MREVIDRYYEGDGLVLKGYHSSCPELPFLMGPIKHTQAVDPSAVRDKLEEVSASLRSIDYNGSFFEIAEANREATDEDVMLHVSTYSSSMTGNAGNAYEFAAQAVRYPNHRQLYVASFGNGGTGALSSKERRYANKTGRFTWEKDGETVPLPSIQNLQGAFQKNQLNVTRLMGTDSAGGPYATSLGLAMNKDQLTHAFFSERSGFVPLSMAGIAKGILYTEVAINAKDNKERTCDPNALTDAMIDEAKEALTKYEESVERLHLRRHMVGKAALVQSLWTSMQALRRGPSDKGNPLVEDTLALLNQQPNAQLTFGMAERDPLYKSPYKAHKAARLFLGELAARGGMAQVIMVPQMSHAYNTHFPSLYHAIKREALDL